MRKRLLVVAPLVVAILVSFCVGAVAGSHWGEFDGYPITRVLLNGQEISSDVPAISFHGRTMVPARLLAEALGAQVDWDEESSTAIISAPELAARTWPRQVEEYLQGLPSQTPGWDCLLKPELFQPVNAEAEANGYKWHVYAVLADATGTHVIFTVTGDDPGTPIVYQPRSCTFNGRELRPRGGGGKLIDGVFVGILSLDPVPAPVGTITVSASGIVSGMGEIEGSWVVSFPVSRTKCDALTKEYQLDEQRPLGTGTVTFTRLVVAPTRTRLEARWAGTIATGLTSNVPKLATFPPQAADQNGWGTKLLGPDGSELARPIGGSGVQSHCGDDGQASATYTMFFDRIEQLPDEIVMRVVAAVHVAEKTQVPLELGASLTAADGHPVTVIAVDGATEAGKATIGYEFDQRFPLTCSDWQVLDDTGALTRTMTGPVFFDRLELSWQLPTGRKAVALVLPGYWTVQDAGEVRVPTK